MRKKSWVYHEILLERQLQDEKWGLQRDLTPAMWLMILMEEVGELSRAALELDKENWKEELTQVAAVAFAMIEFGDSIIWPNSLKGLNEGIEPYDASITRRPQDK